MTNNINKNLSISEVFDNVMSENPPGSTSLAALRKNIVQPSVPVIRSQPPRIQPPTITENIELTTSTIKKKPIKNNNFGRKPKIQNIKKPIIRQRKVIQPITQPIQSQSNLADISKKAVLGSTLFILLSIPHTSCLFEYVVANNTTIDNYKTVVLKALIFSIVFVLLSKYVC